MSHSQTRLPQRWNQRLQETISTHVKRVLKLKLVFFFVFFFLPQKHHARLSFVIKYRLHLKERLVRNLGNRSLTDVVAAQRAETEEKTRDGGENQRPNEARNGDSASAPVGGPSERQIAKSSLVLLQITLESRIRRTILGEQCSVSMFPKSPKNELLVIAD